MPQLPTVVKIKLMDGGVEPVFAYPGDACADIRSRQGLSLEHGEIARVWTGLYLEIPRGWEGQVRGRSGLNARGILVQWGTIDSDYRGELAVVIMNLSGEPQRIAAGDRIAQLGIRRVDPVAFRVVPELTPSARGAGGFGSTGT